MLLLRPMFSDWENRIKWILQAFVQLTLQLGATLCFFVSFDHNILSVSKVLLSCHSRHINVWHVDKLYILMQ